jgi:hypothetical protein
MGAVATMTVVWATILQFDRLSEIIRRPSVPACDFKAIDALLTTQVVPYDDWETLYRLRLQVEHEACVPGASGPAGAA